MLTVFVYLYLFNIEPDLFLVMRSVPNIEMAVYLPVKLH